MSLSPGAEGSNLQRLRRRLVWLPAVFPIVIGLTVFSSTLQDDTYISYWAAHALSTTGEIVNYNGERIEQSSSLLHTLVLAVLRKLLRVDLGLIGPLLSASCAAMTVLLTQHMVRRCRPDLEMTAGSLLGTSLLLSHWTFSGLETTLAAAVSVALLLAWSSFLDQGSRGRTVLTVVTTTACFVLVRPEAGLLAIALAGSCAWTTLWLMRRSEAAHRAIDRVRVGRSLALFTVAGAMVVGVGLFRVDYFGSWFPQPVLAKVAPFEPGRLVAGARYVYAYSLGTWGFLLWLLAAMGAIRVTIALVRGSRPPAAILTTAVLFALVYTGFVVAVGGDWMPLGRFIVVLLPPAVLLATVALGEIPHATLRHILVVMVIASQLAITVLRAQDRSSGMPLWCRPEPSAIAPKDFAVGWFEQREREIAADFNIAPVLTALIDDLNTMGESPVVVLSGQMGFVPYRVMQKTRGEVRWVDRWSLTTRDFVLHPLTARQPRFSTGLFVSYDFLFRHRRDLGALARPSIIWDWEASRNDGFAQSLMEQNGYTVVYRQEGTVTTSCPDFPGSTVRTEKFIAVRADLVSGVRNRSSYRF